MTTYSHAEIRPTAHQPLATGPVFDGLPEGVNAADLDFQGATDLPDNTEWAIFTRDSGERMMVWRVESKENEMPSEIESVYVVYRHGANAANQSRCNKRIVGTVTATSREEACERMASRVTVYRNQHLEAVPFSRLGKKDQQLARERDIDNQIDNEAWDEVARDILAAEAGREGGE